jgi:replicative DNA helicase
MNWIHERLPGMTEAELLDLNEAVNKAIAKGLNDETAKPIFPITDGLADYLKAMGDGSKPYEGLQTGIDVIDHLIGGLNRFVLLAARAGTGKSTLAMQMAVGVIETEQVPVIYYSFEMPRADIMTLALQNLRRGHDQKLTRHQIVIQGNSTLNSDVTAAIHESADALKELGGLLFVIDASDGDPTTDRMSADIAQVRQLTGAKDVLIIIDSIQDLVKPGNAGSTAAEAETAQKLVEIQMATEATILAISQKSKGASLDDPYAAVLGSVSLIHKPTSVLELISVYDLLRPIKDPSVLSMYRRLADQVDVPRPVIARVIKGRHNGTGHASLKFYGRHAYFEVGQIKDYATGENDLYAINSFTN